MTQREEIDKAIGAHGSWKLRLKTAISTGKMESPIETIRADNQCAFGKWLHGPDVTPADRNLEIYKKVRDLHAEFHKTAAKVVELALSGNNGEAEKMMSLQGPFTVASSKLTAAMVEWRKAFA